MPATLVSWNTGVDGDGFRPERIRSTGVPLEPAACASSRRASHVRESQLAAGARQPVVDEDCLNFGLTGEIAAVVAERLDGVALKAPVCRLGVPGLPIPYSRPLEMAVIPSVQRIVEVSRRLMDSRLKAAAWPVVA